MPRPVDKNKMQNDIILTIALIISLIAVKYVIEIAELNNCRYYAAICFILTFTFIKIAYNMLSKIVHWFKKK